MAEPLGADHERLTISLEKPKGEASALAVAKVMEAFIAVVEETQQEMNQNQQLLINARPFGKGSFEIPLELILVGTAGAVALYQEHPFLEELIRIIRQFIEVKVRLKGKPLPKASSNEGVVVEKIKAENLTINLIMNSTVNKAFNHAMSEVLKDEEVRSIRVLKGAEKVEFVKIPREALPYLQKRHDLIEDPDLIQKLPPHEETLVIHTPVLEGNARWKMIRLVNGQVIEVSMDDEEYMKDVRRGRETFAAGDRLKVNLEVIQKYDHSLKVYIPDKYVVRKVVGKSAAPPPNQKSLFADEDDSKSVLPKKRKGKRRKK